MRQFDSDEYYYDAISDSESGLHLSSIDPGSFPQQHNSLMPALPGFIYMCNSKGRRKVLNQRSMYMPNKKPWVEPARVRPGAKLFIFDFEVRLLWGVYEATTFPHYRSKSRCKDTKFFKLFFQPDQIFKKPLPESMFGCALRDNYHSPFKFSFELTSQQVKDLITLFISQEDRWMKSSYRVPPRSVLIGERCDQEMLPAVYQETFRNSRSLSKGFHGKCSTTLTSRKELRRWQKNTFHGALKSPSEASKKLILSFPSREMQDLRKGVISHCDLKLGRSEASLQDYFLNSGYDEQSSFANPEKQVYSGFSTCLEEGEIGENSESESHILNDQNAGCQDKVNIPQTRNFLEILEHGSSPMMTHSRYSEVKDDKLLVANKHGNVCSLAHKQETKNEAHHDKNQSWMTEDNGSLVQSSQQKSRISTAKKENLSVWMRLSDPRLMRKIMPEWLHEDKKMALKRATAQIVEESGGTDLFQKPDVQDLVHPSFPHLSSMV